MTKTTNKYEHATYQIQQYVELADGSAEWIKVSTAYDELTAWKRCDELAAKSGATLIVLKVEETVLGRSPEAAATAAELARSALTEYERAILLAMPEDEPTLLSKLFFAVDKIEPPVRDLGVSFGDAVARLVTVNFIHHQILESEVRVYGLTPNGREFRAMLAGLGATESEAAE